MKTYITRKLAKKIVDTMKEFPDHDVFLLEIDTSSGIGSTVSLTIDIMHNNIGGKFTTTVEDTDNW
jgi:hypothetical protein